MMSLFTRQLFIFEGRPLSKDNEKIVGRHGKNFTSARFKLYERGIANQAEYQMRQSGWETWTIPVKVRMRFYFKNDTRLDLHNSPKSVCDALNGIVWEDDRQIHVSELSIEYDERERVELEVEACYKHPWFNGNGFAFALKRGMPKSVYKAIKDAIAGKEGVSIEII